MLALAVLSAVVFGSDWLVRTRRINPFNPVARFFRRTLDPLMAPVERRVIRSGGNPATAPWWTFAVVVVGGILLLAALDYVRQTAFEMAAASHGGVMPIVRLLIHWTVLFLQLALIIRVIASWLGMGQFSPWVRWALSGDGLAAPATPPRDPANGDVRHLADRGVVRAEPARVARTECAELAHDGIVADVPLPWWPGRISPPRVGHGTQLHARGLRWR